MMHRNLAKLTTLAVVPEHPECRPSTPRVSYFPVGQSRGTARRGLGGAKAVRAGSTDTRTESARINEIIFRCLKHGERGRV